VIFPATLPSLYTCLRIQNCHYCLLSLLCRGRHHWNMDTSSPCLNIHRHQTSKPKTHVAVFSEKSVTLSVITSYPRIIKYWYLLPCELQKSGSKISLFIVSNSLEKNPSGAVNPLSKNSATSIELGVSLSTSRQPTIWPHLIVLFKLQFNVT